MGMRQKISHGALDCHRRFSRLTLRDEHNAIDRRQRLEHADRDKLREQLRELPPGTPLIREGSFGWGWMAEQIQACGHQPHLANCRKVDGWREARGMAKNNRLDADLRSELWPQQPRWWEVWLAPPEVRDQRERLRYRMALVGVPTMTRNRIHAILHRHGVLHDLSDLFGKKGLKFLEGLLEGPEPVAGQGPAGLRATARQVLQGHLKLLAQGRRQIAQARRELRKKVRRCPAAEIWRSWPGISWVLAYTLQAEIGDLSRLADSKHLASYALRVPRAADSGEETDQAPLGRHVGHLGRRTPKWAFIEAAPGAVRRSAHVRAIFDRRTDQGQRDRNQGDIAVARELCRVGFACARQGRNYSEQRPERPGQEPKREMPGKETAGKEIQCNDIQCNQSDNMISNDHAVSASPGPGRPRHPMVAAGGKRRPRTSW